MSYRNWALDNAEKKRDKLLKEVADIEDQLTVKFMLPEKKVKKLEKKLEIKLKLIEILNESLMITANSGLKDG